MSADTLRPDNASAAALARVRGKGVGVVARRDLPPFTFVAAYPGERISQRELQRRAAAGRATGRYAVAHYAVVGGRVSFNYVVDPGISRGRLSARYAGKLGPRVNEPSDGPPNLVWVWNVPDETVELWTGARGARRGDELTACYGADGGYARTYATPCAAPGHEPALHAVLRPGDRPRPLSQAVLERAILARHHGAILARHHGLAVHRV